MRSALRLAAVLIVSLTVGACSGRGQQGARVAASAWEDIASAIGRNPDELLDGGRLAQTQLDAISSAASRRVPIGTEEVGTVVQQLDAQNAVLSAAVSRVSAPPGNEVDAARWQHGVATVACKAYEAGGALADDTFGGFVSEEALDLASGGGSDAVFYAKLYRDAEEVHRQLEQASSTGDRAVIVGISVGCYAVDQAQ